MDMLFQITTAEGLVCLIKRLALLIPIGKKIFFQTNINYSYENVILTGTKHHDLFVSFGIGVARKQKDEKKSPT